MTIDAPNAPTPRAVPTRRVDFGFGEVDLPRHFMDGDLLFSHIAVVMSCLFPEGEDFFVRSVRNYRDRITDPELRRQVAGFIGQEAMHSREHAEFNRALGELGYPVRFLDARVRIGLRIQDRTSRRIVRLAMTAALEHFTAIFAEVLLSSEELQNSSQVPEVRELFLWHALEESEHKAVAFDVFRAVGGSERIRKNTMRVSTFFLLTAIATGTLVSLCRDPAARDLGELRRSFRRLRRNPILSREVRVMVRDYYRTGFHPDDRDTTELLARWRDQLFGPEGEINHRLKGAA